MIHMAPGGGWVAKISKWMNRITLIQKIIDKGNFSTYLEIGSQSGKSFLPIKCKNKIAVDPVFDIPIEKKIKWFIKHEKEK